MISIITAIHWEAKPFIDRFGLKRDLSVKSFELFKGEGISLIVSGIGKIRSAIATTYLLGHLPEPKLSSVFNIGVCGAKIEFGIGDLFLVNKITDNGTGKRYYSDLLIRHSLHEAGIETFDTPVDESEMSDPDFDLVDMEASGFFEAASVFLPPSQIFCLKVVSDHLEVGSLSRDIAESLIGRHVETIEQFMMKQAALSQPTLSALDEAERELLSEVGECLRLTLSQTIEFADLARAFKVRGGDISKLNGFKKREIKAKDESKRAFEELRAILRG